MRRHAFALLAVSLFACSEACSKDAAEAAKLQAKPAAEVAQPKPPTTEAVAIPSYDAKTLYATTSFSGAAFSPDEQSILLSSDASGIFNVYAQATRGGEPKPLTQSAKESTFAVSYFPKDERILYTADGGGNELTHVFVRELDGTSKDLTPGEQTKAFFVDFTADGQAFFVATNERDSKFFDVYRHAVDGYARTRVFTNRGGFGVAAISRDGRKLALVKQNDNADSDVYVQTIGKGEPELVTKHEGKVLHGVFTFTPDGSGLIYGSDQDGEFQQAFAYDLASKSKTLLVPGGAADVVDVTYSKNGRFRAVTLNQEARPHVTVLDTQANAPVQFPLGEDAFVSSIEFSPSESKIAYYVESDRTPPNLFVLEVGRQPVQLTHALHPKVDGQALVAGEHLRYASFDGLQVPGILYRPKQASSANKVPALLWVHGGPGGQSRHRYDPTIQHLVNHGYAVFAVNNRGSSGYGKTFYHLDDRRHGDVDLKDCIAARKYLEGLEFIDGARVGIFGGSYGGFMVAAALTFTPEAFDVGIDIFGVTNWERTLESVPPWWASFRDSLYAELGDPATDKQRLHDISPLFFADRIRKPLLVIQGANDPRVLKVESDELVAAVRKNGVAVEYVVFPDEGHGFRKRENRIAASEAYLTFLDRHLKGGPGTKVAQPEAAATARVEPEAPGAAAAVPNPSVPASNSKDG